MAQNIHFGKNNTKCNRNKKNRSILLVKIEYSKEMKCLYFLETIDNL